MSEFLIVNGMDSREVGLTCTNPPSLLTPSERLTKVAVPGRSGYLTISDDSYESITKKVTLFFEGTDPSAAIDLIRSARTLVFSNEPDFLYYGHLSGGDSLDPLIFDMIEFDAVFECDPEKRQREPDTIAATSGMTIINPGNRKTRPTFEVTGSGTIVLTVGSQTVTLAGVSGTYIVDGNLMECYDSSGVSKNSSMTGDFPIVASGAETMISWTGSATVVVRPNWRWI